ncbi:hypothetical protein E3Q06_04378 [Wallemia mellicola]|uniref:General negative regulator of transcription subunit n=1 Tax=Wallemia mellicola TaxID=1708541 RepID=A0AB38MPX9_9BASI|nr:hypothetical protein E3Q24_04387 [Wallemia mellicola]TIB78443.1 hypothetical protein E3Q21_04381 [Wallemia mellicola]TIB82978.1 hypothetical protein E3Q20_04366 [Wallemia mellicola]TIC36724.1 hypothetical protein E3Q07_04383 [Wallemia mellicola]TIC43310.1 hypothetical protein E3Q06_04378 [Wallemia mellicola]
MAQRKLLTEVDRTLKKVSEGVELFESMYEKLQTSNNQTQKEKLEVDLKTQIKKLQRMRDSIKTWISSSDIKDKSELMSSRKLIETQMERFKACEKEIKTKAFSKEGLIAATRLDPKDQIKQECSNWLGHFVDELSRQIETAEAEIEQLSGATSKRSKKSNATQERVSELEQLNERRNWHISRLELTMRLLENDQLSVDQINNIKDDIQYFVESNGEEEFEEDEGIYDELNLDEEEQMYGMGTANAQPNDEQASSHDSISVTDEPVQPPSKPSKKSSIDEDSLTPKKTKKPSITSPDSSNNGAIPAPNFNQPPVAKSTASPAAQQAKPVPAPPTIKYATAAANAVANTASSAPVDDEHIEEQPRESQDQLESVEVDGSQQEDGQSIPPTQVQRSESEEQSQTSTASAKGLPYVLSDLAASFENAKQKSRSNSPNRLHQALESTMSGVPEPSDADRPRYYVPKNLWTSPSYYPQVPKKDLEHSNLFSRLETDTLFYIFYYMQGTYQQYLAARELKKQSWRFHKQYLTWFQRHSEPNQITDDYEQGMITRRLAAARINNTLSKSVYSTSICRNYSSDASRRHKAVYREIYPAMIRIGVVAMIVYYGLQVSWSYLYKQRLEIELEKQVKELENKVDDRYYGNSKLDALAEAPKSTISQLRSWIGL